MIIESAFYKVPELLLGHRFPYTLYESSVTTYLALAVLTELNARNIEHPARHIHTERQFPTDRGAPAAGRADLYIDLSGVYTHGLWHGSYGMKPHNWLEVKYFGGIGRAKGEETKTQNCASILLDLIRLCVFVREERSKHRDQSRYLICLFNRSPAEYLAFTKHSGTLDERTWLRLLLTPGRQHLVFTSAEEPPSFTRTLVGTAPLTPHFLKLSMDVVTRDFEPIDRPSEYLYWGYLIRIIRFEIALGELSLAYDESSDDWWSEEKQIAQLELIKRFKGVASTDAVTGGQTSE